MKRLSSYIVGAGLALSVAAFTPAAFAQNYNANGVNNTAKTAGTASLGNGGNANPGVSSGPNAARYAGIKEKNSPGPTGPIVHGVPANNPGTNTAPTTAGGSLGTGAYGTAGRGSGNGTAPGYQVGYGTSGEAQKWGPNPNVNKSAQQMGHIDRSRNYANRQAHGNSGQ
jgi:hypothetical protein